LNFKIKLDKNKIKLKSNN